MTNDDINKFLNERGITAHVLEGFNNAIVGVTTDCREEGDLLFARITYDYDLCLGCLVAQGLSEDEAIEYFEYNALRALQYLPEFKRPIIIHSLEEY
jgi:hypothetical protein